MSKDKIDLFYILYMIYLNVPLTQERISYRDAF